MVGKRLRQSKSARAGIVFPVAKVRKFLKTHHRTSRLRISEGAGVYAAAVMEYLAAELLELGGNACKALRKKRLVPRHLMLAIKNDAELEKLLHFVTIPQAGVVPNLSPKLLPNKDLAKATAKKSGTAKTAASAKPVTKAVAKAVAKPVAKAVAKPVAKPVAKAVAKPPVTVTVLSEKQLHGGQKLTVVKGDISTIRACAIVHPTSSGYATAGQVGSSITRRGGQQMRQQIQQLAAGGSLGNCQAKECQAVGLGSDWVINCNGPSWNSGGAAAAVTDLEKTVKNCLTLADAKAFASIALPSIGSGSAGFPKHTAAQTILQTIRSYFAGLMSSSIKQVYFVLYDQESIDVYTSELERLDQ